MEKTYIINPQICVFLLFVVQLMCTNTDCAASPSNSSSILCKNSERKALLKIKHFLEKHVNLESWVGEDCCAWQGVGCDNVTGNIIVFEAIGSAGSRRCTVYGGCRRLEDIELKANSVSFNTIMSAGLLDLKHITHLKLSQLYLQGPIPHLIKLMTHLRYLNLTHNHISGNVPPQLGNLTNLEVLDLSYTYLTIDSLVWASSLSNLRLIDLSSTLLSKNVDLNQLPSVSYLSLSTCFDNVTYILSHSFVNDSPILSSLKYLDLSQSNIESPLTPNLGNLSSLISLDISGNSFKGSVPRWLKKLKSLQVLDVRINSFSHVEGGIWVLVNNSCHFQHLDLSYNNFQGEILQPHVNISKCSRYELDFLDISNNQITGTLPSFLGQLKLLKHLDLSSNPIQDNVSLTHIGDLSKLSYLDMSYTNLSLNITSDWLPPFQLQTFRARSCKIINPPNWLHTQASIEELDLSNTSMSGELKDWISNMSNLQNLNLSYNLLRGPLPQQLASQNLQYLDMQNNDLSGTFPDWYLEHVDNIDLSSNHLSGSIPQPMGQNCTLTTLLLNDNSFEGIIPPSLGKCSNLVILNLSYNNLSGYIPPWTNDDLPNITILQLQRNQLGKANAKVKDVVLANENNGTIPESLCSLDNLEVLDLQKNQLIGSIPDCWQNSSMLTMINLSSNKLSGVIPCSFLAVEYSSLEYLHLNDNELHGEIPSCLSGSEVLKILDVGGNNLSGLVPSWFKGETFPSLNVLRLSQNFLNSTIPNELCSLSKLRVLDLSNNQLTGSIPSCFGNLTGINMPPENITLDLFKFSTAYYDTGDDSKFIEFTRENSVNENIAGIAREYSTVLEFFTTIDLSGNHLEGTIPEDLTNLSGLIVLTLARNHLTGNIPEKFGDMRALQTLDLSRNNLFGRIPPSLGNIDSLTHFNVSFNNLSGPIPTNRHFDTLYDPSAYAGNLYICGDTLPKKCTNHVKQPSTPSPRVQDNVEVEDKKEKLWFYLVVMLGFATGFWGIIGTLWLKKSWRHALFMSVEDVYDWLYVGITLKMSKLKKWMTKENSEE